MSRRSPFVADTLRELRRIANRHVTADPRRLCGPDGSALRLKDIPNDIAAAIQEAQFDKAGRLQRIVLVDKARAAGLLMRMIEAEDGLVLDDQEQGMAAGSTKVRVGRCRAPASIRPSLHRQRTMRPGRPLRPATVKPPPRSRAPACYQML